MRFRALIHARRGMTIIFIKLSHKTRVKFLCCPFVLHYIMLRSPAGSVFIRLQPFAPIRLTPSGDKMKQGKMNKFEADVLLEVCTNGECKRTTDLCRIFDKPAHEINATLDMLRARGMLLLRKAGTVFHPSPTSHGQERAAALLLSIKL